MRHSAVVCTYQTAEVCCQLQASGLWCVGTSLSPLSLPLLLAGLLNVLRPSPQPAMELLRMDDTELGLKCCVLLRMNDADREDDWLPDAL